MVWFWDGLDVVGGRLREKFRSPDYVTSPIMLTQKKTLGPSVIYSMPTGRPVEAPEPPSAYEKSKDISRKQAYRSRAVWAGLFSPETAPNLPVMYQTSSLEHMGV